MVLIRSTLFNISFWLLIAVLGLTALPFTLLCPRLAFPVSRIWASTTLFFLRVFCGITYEVKGKEHIPQGPALVASKHQSAWDTVIFWMLLPRPIYVLKKELIYLPIFGWYLLFLKSIHIDRKSGGKAVKAMLRQASARIKDKSQIVIFPEGTRIIPGTPSTFHPGVAALYQHLDVPVVPVALNSGYYWSRNAFTKKPGKITIEFMPPIMPGLKSRDFLKTLQETIEQKSQALAQHRKDDLCDQMMWKAYKYIEKGNSTAAFHLADELEKLKFSGAFEIRALTYASINQKDKAIQTLEKSVKIAPNAWPLWQLLGSYYSDNRNYVQAEQAYENALAAGEPDYTSVYYNYAIMQMRSEKIEAAKQTIKKALAHPHFDSNTPELKELCHELLARLEKPTVG